MTEFLRNIPKPKRNNFDNLNKIVEEEEKREKEEKKVPEKGTNKNIYYEYLKRKHLKIYSNKDFKDGGAYPEIHVEQYPNGLGLKNKNTYQKVLKYIDENNVVKYDNLINEEVLLYNKKLDAIEPNEKIKNLRKKKILSEHKDREEKYNQPLYKPNEEEEKEIIENTRRNIENLLKEKLDKSVTNKKEERYYRYIPQKKLNPFLEERIIKVVEKSIDPLEVSKFKHKRIPNMRDSPDYPILRSPERKLNKEEEKDWAIPPCVSNWKNNKGYNIPLDKRIQSDNRKLRSIDVNDKFAQLSEFLYVAEKKAREEIRIRNNVIKHKKLREKEEKEKALKNLALEAKKEKGEEEKEGGASIISKRKREIEREYKLEKNLKKMKNYESKFIEEQIALNKGDINKTSTTSIHDVSLFNINNDTLHVDNDETYQIYDTALFDKNKMANSHLYKFSSERMKKTIQNLETSQNNEPIKFIKETSDPFGLDSLLSEANKKK